MSSSDSSSSSSESSSDSDDDERTKQRKKNKIRAKVMRRQKRSEEEEKQREQRSQEMKRRREYLEMIRKKGAYQRFLLEKQRNPNKEPIVSMLATARNRIKNHNNKTKKVWYNMSPPKSPSPIQIGEKQNETPSISDWRKMMGLQFATPSPQKSRNVSKGSKGGKRRLTMKNKRQKHP
jgi:hypothetical protein